MKKHKKAVYTIIIWGTR